MMRWIRVAKNQPKSWETRIKIDRNHHNIIFLNIEITLLFNKSFYSIIIFMEEKVWYFLDFRSYPDPFFSRDQSRIHITHCNGIYWRWKKAILITYVIYIVFERLKHDLLRYTPLVLIVTKNSFSKSLRGGKWDKNNAEEGQLPLLPPP